MLIFARTSAIIWRNVDQEYEEMDPEMEPHNNLQVWDEFFCFASGFV